MFVCARACFYAIAIRNLYCFQAISLKESQLVGNITMNIEDSTQDDSTPVRIIPPKEEVLEDSPNDDFNSNKKKLNDIQDVKNSLESQENPLDDKEIDNLLKSLSTDTGNGNS